MFKVIICVYVLNFDGQKEIQDFCIFIKNLLALLLLFFL
jgi:hypothetical protein